MIGTRSALLGVGLMLSVPAAMAAPPEGGHYVWVPEGAAVVVVPAQTAAPELADVPVARMIVQQDAMMRRIFADMDQLMATALPDPEQMIRSVMQGLPQGPTGSSVVVTSITTPSGTCSQTITYGYPDRGGQPVVNVSGSGNACGTIHSSGPLTVTQPLPAPQTVTPSAPRHERLWTVGYPPHRIATGTPPRT